MSRLRVLALRGATFFTIALLLTVIAFFGDNQWLIWLKDATLFLLIWRLLLYAFIAGLWFKSIRHYFMQFNPLSSIKRVEWLVLILFILIELSIYYNNLV